VPSRALDPKAVDKVRRQIKVLPLDLLLAILSMERIVTWPRRTSIKRSNEFGTRMALIKLRGDAL